MAHHGHHESNVETQALRTMQSRPVSVNLPSISEDELAAEVDEPPEDTKQIFTKTTATGRPRKHSLLTKALHTDTESQDDSIYPHHMNRDLSRASTCSTGSVISSNGFVSDGAITTSTRASTPSSPPPSVALLHEKPALHFGTEPSSHTSNPSQALHVSPVATPGLEEAPVEPTVEAKLGRKRCITFACGRAKAAATESTAPATPEPQAAPAPAPAKRPCMLRFICPMTKTSNTNSSNEAPANNLAKEVSPPASQSSATPTRPILAGPSSREKAHRGSDSTPRNESPRSMRKVPIVHARQLSDSSVSHSEALRFHEFATSEEEVEDWVQESTCYRSRLTLKDTLKKENVIRETCEEAEEEALEDEDDDEIPLDDDEDDDDDDEVSDAGFQTDDEEGFAESDDDSDDGSDYEWWTLRGSPYPTSLVPSVDTYRPTRRSSVTSIMSSSPGQSVTGSYQASRLRRAPKAKSTGPLVIRPGTPELPDSTDFVCGTLDEDRPLEQAYLACMSQRKAAMQKPQDIDPTFPTSDPEFESESDEEDEVPESVQESDTNMLFHGRLENIDGPHPKGKATAKHTRTSANVSPKRGRSPTSSTHRSAFPLSPAPVAHRTAFPLSPAPAARRPNLPPAPCPLIRRPTFPHSPAPMPIAKRPTFPLSPAPRALFGHSPVQNRSPKQYQPNSPRNSLSGSSDGSVAGTQRDHQFLGQRPQLTHTASLPRSPCPFVRRSRRMHADSSASRVTDGEGESTAHEATYNRGAIDIVQGLEFKRLRRRQKFYERYCRKEEKKLMKKEKKHRPPPGKGAQRMRQIGIECAEYRGKRVLSV